MAENIHVTEMIQVATGVTEIMTQVTFYVP